MKINKSQKIALAVLGLAVGAFILDRCLAGPETPPAPVVSAEHTAAQVAIASPPNAGSPALASTAQELSARLETLRAPQGESSTQRDAFAIPSGFAASVDAEHLSINERTAKFQSLHHLKAIIYSNGNSEAVVDTSLIRVGQSLDGFTLESIGKMRAVFGDGNVRTELRITQADGLAE